MNNHWYYRIKQIWAIALGFNLAAMTSLLRGGIGYFCQSCEAAYWKIMERNIYKNKIPEITVRKILHKSEPFHLKLIPYSYEDGVLPFDQTVALLLILVEANPKTVLEIGTFKGHTTRHIAENLPEATIHTVDLPVAYNQQQDQTGIPKDDFHLINSRVVGREFKGQPCASRIVQHFADTASYDFKDVGRPDLFFIDGSHTYEYIKNDSEKCLALCDSPAVFLWHDCDNGHPGVVKFLEEWRTQGRDIYRIAGTPLAYWKKS